MSYDFIVFDGPNSDREHELYSTNYTSNIHQMIYDVLPRRYMDQLKSDEGVPVEVARPILLTLLTALLSDPDRYIAMNPENGWGNYHGFCETLFDVILNTTRHPNTKFRIDA